MTGSVGIFGLGLIGTALAERLLGAGWQVTGCDVDRRRAGLLSGAGGTVGGAERVWQEDTVFSCVFDTDQLAGLIADAPDRTDRQVAHLVSVSTCDPARMPGLGAAAAAKGWRLVEAPISGTSGQLAAGDAVFLLGGDPEDVQAVSPALAAAGRALHHVGVLGHGNRAKLAVNLVLGLNRAALAEGLVFAETLGLEPAAFLDLLPDTAAASAVMKTKGHKMLAGDFEPQGRIEQSAKDFGLILAAAGAQGLPFAQTYARMMRDCLDNGEAGLDNAAVIRAITRAEAGNEPG